MAFFVKPALHLHHSMRHYRRGPQGTGGSSCSVFQMNWTMQGCIRYCSEMGGWHPHRLFL